MRGKVLPEHKFHPANKQNGFQDGVFCKGTYLSIFEQFNMMEEVESVESNQTTGAVGAAKNGALDVANAPAAHVRGSIFWS